jgi:ABC-type multidrug transport system permease subunit
MGLLLIQEIPACFLTMDAAAYAEIYTPFAQSHYETFVLTQFFTIQAGMNYYMLASTLLFERKLTQFQCSLLLIPIFEPVVEQALGVVFDVSSSPEAIVYAKYNNGIFGDFYIYQLLLLAYAGAAVLGAINRQKNAVQ